MATMAYTNGGYLYGSPPQDGRIKELEDRVEQLEDLVNKLMKSNKPSFMDFKFIKEEERREEEERRRREDNRRTITAMRNMFTR